MTPDVSILVLTKNGAATLPLLLNAIEEQQTDFTVETIAVDSGSTDGTRDRLRGRVDRVIEIPASQFNHGLTRNLGLEHCRGRFVVLIVQDAVPDSASWLANLVSPLAANGRLAGTFARQVPRADASAITRAYHARWVAAGHAPHVTFVRSAEAFAALKPMARFLTCAFDNVCSCIRRSTWERFPFTATSIAEDLEWAQRVLFAGFLLAYVPSAVVIHSHDRSARYELGRTYLAHQRLRTLFGLATIPTWPSLARAIATSAVSHVKWTGLASPRTTARALALAVAIPLGQYLGARSADTGRDYLHPRGV